VSWRGETLKILPGQDRCRVKIGPFFSDHETYMNGIGLAAVAKTISKWYVAPAESR